MRNDTIILAPWLTDYRLPQQGQARVLMFPYSGAGSLAYFPWAKAWRERGTTVDFLGVQLPGRESRLRETCITEVPLLVVSGDRDYTPVDYKRAYLAQLRNARLEVIEDSGHATPLDQPQRLNRLLQAFIAEHSAPLPA